MHNFGAELDVDVAQHQRRPQCAESDTTSISLSERAKVALYAREIEKLAEKKSCHSPHQAPDSWDLPQQSLGRIPSKAERVKFFEKGIETDRWAELLDRPQRGNRGTVWQLERHENVEMDADVPADAQSLLHAFEHAIKIAPGSCGRSAKPALKFAEELQLSLHDVIQKGISPGPSSSRASTASGDGPLYDLEASSPEVVSTTPGTATPDIWDSEADPGCYLINDPKGKHALLRPQINAEVTTSCQPLQLPLGLRRAMCAVLPADPETAVKLSSEQVHKLKSLRNLMQDQRQSSMLKSAQSGGKSYHNMRRRFK
jgi:hypothetical protein